MPPDPDRLPPEPFTELPPPPFEALLPPPPLDAAPPPPLDGFPPMPPTPGSAHAQHSFAAGEGSQIGVDAAVCEQYWAQLLD